MTFLVLIGSGAALVGLALGAAFGVWFADRRLRRRLEGVSAEIISLRTIAEDKLAGDDPDLPELLRNLNTAVEQTYRAIDALENQAALTRRKSEGGKEILSSSKDVIRMLEELGMDMRDSANAISLAPPPVSSEEAKKNPGDAD